MNIKAQRKKHDMTQDELSLYTGYSLRTVQRHENGEQTLLKRHIDTYRGVFK